MKKIFLIYIFIVVGTVCAFAQTHGNALLNTDNILPNINGGTGSSLATGTGAVVLATNATLTTPNIGVATATSVNKYTWVAPATSATITVANGKALNVANTLSLTGTDGTTYSFPGTSDAITTNSVTATLSNKALTTPTISATGFTNAQHAHIGATSGGQLTTAALSDYVGWTDYSGTSTVVGFASTTTKIIRYLVVGKMLIVSYVITGTSNSTTTSFTIPYTTPSVSSWTVYGNVESVEDNGVFLNYIGYSYIANNTNVVTLAKQPDGTAWMDSGTKYVAGTKIIPIQ